MKKILFAGESWTVLSIHQKGFDSFQTVTYEEGGGILIKAFEKAGYEVCYMPCHVAAEQFPDTAEALAAYDAVVLSDIGANTLLLSRATFMQSKVCPNRLDAIAQYVKNGGAFAMMGGYMSFGGVDGKGKYEGTAIEDILPVGIYNADDRVEQPQGIGIKVVAEHEILCGIDGKFPHVLGYNKLIEKDAGDVLLRLENGDIMAAAQTVDKGKTFVFASDIAPHWAPPEFCQWKHYNTLFGNVADWLTTK